jgi:hypothetical protein
MSVKNKPLDYENYACSTSGRRLIIKKKEDTVTKEIEDDLTFGLKFKIKRAE